MTTEMEQRMGRFVSEWLGVSLEEGARLRQQGYERYGTTLRWLQVEAGLSDSGPFLEAVHPADVHRFIAPDPGLRALLDSIALPKSVLTNSPLIHAKRILAYLGIESCFEGVYDLVSNGFVGKPHPRAYERALSSVGRQAGEVLFIDDVPAYLAGFRDLGGHCLLVDEFDRYPSSDFPRIRRLSELPSHLDF